MQITNQEESRKRFARGAGRPMLPSMTPESVQAEIGRQAANWSLSLSAAQVANLARYFDLVLKWNARINLTGARDHSELLHEHLPDSLAMAQAVTTEARVIDVGSGGGLPALPFALARPDCHIHLMEPRAKRVAFLRTAIRELHLTSVIVSTERVEQLVPVVAPYDAASSRATFAPAEWLDLARPLVRDGGQILVLSTPDIVGGLTQRPTRELAYQLIGGQRRVLACFTVPRGTTEPPPLG